MSPMPVSSRPPSNGPRVDASRRASQNREVAAPSTQEPKATERRQLHTQDTFQNPGLDAINQVKLQTGADHSCVATVRTNLRRAGLGGLPDTTSDDKNNARGMMVQMLQSNQWDSAKIPGAKQQTITSPYGSVQAQVLSGKEYLEAASKGQIPEGAVVFQTHHKEGWAYDKGARGNDVGIVRDGRIFNYKEFQGMTVYNKKGKETTEVVVLLPKPTAP